MASTAIKPSHFPVTVWLAITITSDAIMIATWPQLMLELCELQSQCACNDNSHAPVLLLNASTHVTWPHLIPQLCELQ